MDVVLISDAKTPELKLLTQQAINTCGEHHIIVVESSKEHFEKVDMVYPNDTFGYNRYLNIGAKYGTHECIGFFNNDVIFHKGWERITETMKKRGCESGSTFCPNHWGHKGFRGVRIGKSPGRELAGWAIITTRAWWQRMGGFDERPKFWTAENYYYQQLKKSNVKHVIDCSCVVTHLGSKTLVTLQPEVRKDYEVHEVQKYNRDYNANILGWGRFNG